MIYWPYIVEENFHFILLHKSWKNKSVAYSSQKSHTGQLDFHNWLADGNSGNSKLISKENKYFDDEYQLLIFNTFK